MIPAPNAVRIQVEPIVIPDKLNSTDIVTRLGAYELVSSSTGRWGERLAIGLRDALASDLSLRLPSDVIITSHDIDPSARQLLITVSAFDVWADGRCILTASWRIDEKHGSASPLLTQDTILLPSSEAAGLKGDAIVVASMAAMIEKLSDRVVLSLGVIGQPPSAANGANP